MTRATENHHEATSSVSLLGRFFLLMILALAAVPGLAQDASLAQMTAESELVFRGTVQEVRYATSLPTGPESAEIPYTFVTYRVDEAFKGQAGDTLTLRFVGGLRASDGVRLQVSHVPLFDEGDEDVLFVRNNTRTNFPLVSREQGRMRVLVGQIYTENGQEVRMDADRQLSIGQRWSFPEVTSHRLDTQFVDRHQDVVTEPDTGASQAIDVERFEQALRQLAADPTLGRSRRQIVSADPEAPFQALLPRPVAPPADPAPATSAPDRATAEELEASRQAGGSPVLHR